MEIEKLEKEYVGLYSLLLKKINTRMEHSIDPSYSYDDIHLENDEIKELKIKFNSVKNQLLKIREQ